MLRTTFDQLAFHLADSPTYRAFCLLGLGAPAPKRASLHDNISRLRPETLQAVHRALVDHAVEKGIESAQVVRTDTTPVAAPMRAPSDSLLLGDAVRVLERLLRRAQTLIPMALPTRRRRVRRRVVGLLSTKPEQERAALYHDLIQDTKQYVEAALFAAQWLEGCEHPKAYLLSMDLRSRAETALRIVDQTERRIFDKESVPATEKTVSLFEGHADILTKRLQEVYGHKVCLSFGRTGVVLAAEVLRGNPADVTQMVPSLEQVQRNTGKTPKKMAADRGFTSKDNLAELKQRGVEQVGFSKGRGLSSQEQCGGKRAHRELRRFRAGVEGLISWLKRSLGMGKSRWKGDQGFQAYIWGVVVTASVQAIAQAG
jgi:IS5 family transposase